MKKISILTLVFGGMLMMSNANAAAVDGDHLISHRATASLEQLISEARVRIDAYPGAELSKADMLLMLDQLLEHPVGQSVFMGKGLNGQATQFFISGAPSDTNPIIRWICDKAPVVLATQERFRILLLCPAVSWMISWELISQAYTMFCFLGLISMKNHWSLPMQVLKQRGLKK